MLDLLNTGLYGLIVLPLLPLEFVSEFHKPLDRVAWNTAHGLAMLTISDTDQYNSQSSRN